MDPVEIQAKATIASALIVSRAVDVPSIPASYELCRGAIGRALDPRNLAIEISGTTDPACPPGRPLHARAVSGNAGVAYIWR
jgi:hypothetical protein